MSGGGKFRSGDTVPPQMLGQDPSLDRALSKLNQDLDPDEDALYVKPDWSERPDVSLTPISQQITQELDPTVTAAIQRGERITSSPPEQPTAGMSDLYKRRMITVQTATVPRGEAEVAEESPELVPPAVELVEEARPAQPAHGISKKLALLIGVSAGMLILLLGALLGHDVGRKGDEHAETSPTSAAAVATAGTVEVPVSAAPLPTPTPAPETTSSSTAAAAASDTPAASLKSAAPSVTARQAPVVQPTPAPRPAHNHNPPQAAPSSTPPAPKPLWLLGD
ncbi:MAG: hypothetical protein AB7K71_04680 [Polyangiaceae bacterium]